MSKIGFNVYSYKGYCHLVLKKNSLNNSPKFSKGVLEINKKKLSVQIWRSKY